MEVEDWVLSTHATGHKIHGLHVAIEHSVEQGSLCATVSGEEGAPRLGPEIELVPARPANHQRG